ncbi:hypothetical protein BC826DRAFT_914883 [Russula brevipes]|nr:hypothetical protein BC826DRAFT_914883 [Russula brevipes]
MQFFTLLLSALALAASTTASPIDVAKRNADIVVTPTVFSPRKGSVWTVGSKQVVQWDTSRIPPEGLNYTGELVLGYNDGTQSENLDVDHPLAQNFKLAAGSQTITIPNVPYRSKYFVVLIGDSGNRSPYFTISQK